jgi:hypothetical protein
MQDSTVETSVTKINNSSQRIETERCAEYVGGCKVVEVVDARHNRTPNTTTSVTIRLERLVFVRANGRFLRERRCA